MRLLLFIVLGVIASDALAQTVVSFSALDDIKSQFLDLIQAWQEPLSGFARQLLFILAGISLAWTLAQMIFRNADLNDLLLELTRQVIIIGFFLAVIANIADWSQAVVTSFTTAAQEATAEAGIVTEISVAGTLEQGIDLVKKIIDKAKGIGGNVVAVLIAGPIMLIYAALAGYQLLVLAEMYIVTGAGIIFLGFGALAQTQDIAKRYLLYILSVSSKLFTLYLVIGFTQQIFAEIDLSAESWNSRAMITTLGLTFLALMLATTLPGMVQGIVNGSSIGAGGPALTGMVTAVASVAANQAVKAATVGASATATGALAGAQAYRQAGGGMPGMTAGLKTGSAAGLKVVGTAAKDALASKMVNTPGTASAVTSFSAAMEQAKRATPGASPEVILGGKPPQPQPSNPTGPKDSA